MLGIKAWTSELFRFVPVRLGKEIYEVSFLLATGARIPSSLGYTINFHIQATKIYFCLWLEHPLL